MDNDMCRICLAENIRMRDIADLQNIYEKLTELPYRDVGRPLKACYICYARLRNCQCLMKKCRQSEQILAKMVDGIQPDHDIIQMQLSNFKSLITSPMIHTSTYEMQEAMVKKEIELPIGDFELKVESEHREDEMEDYLSTEPDTMYSIPDPLEDILHSDYEEPSSEGEVPLVAFKNKNEISKNTCNLQNNMYGTIERASKTVKSNFKTRRFKNNETVSDTAIVKEDEMAIPCELHLAEADDIKEYSNDLKDKINNTVKKEFQHETYNDEYSNDASEPNKIQHETHSNDASDQNKIQHETYNDDYSNDASEQNKIKHETYSNDASDQNKIQHKTYSNDASDQNKIQHETYNDDYSNDASEQNKIKHETYNDDYSNDASDQNKKPKGYKNSSKRKKRTTNKKSSKKICPICNKSLSSKSNLKIHLAIHTGENPYQCHTCGKCFARKKQMQNHIMKHTGEKPFKCEFCPKAFLQKHNLQSHYRLHSTAILFECDVCHKQLTTKPALVHHIRIHTGEKPYKCDQCPKSFKLCHTLKNHKRTHTGEKPYKCNHCEMCFTKNSNLKAHIRIHTGERPYKCEVCQKAFNQKSALTTHMRTHKKKKLHQKAFNEKV